MNSLLALAPEALAALGTLINHVSGGSNSSPDASTQFVSSSTPEIAHPVTSVSDNVNSHRIRTNADAQVALHPRALLPSSPSVISHPLDHQPTLQLPFQFILGSISSEDSHNSDFIFATLPQFVFLTTPYRRAKLLHLELVLHPLVPLNNGYNIIAAWCQANVALTGGEALATPGSVIFTTTQYATLNCDQILPCPLHSVNPMVKDSVTYNDTPRLHLAPYKVDNPGRAMATLRGVIEVSSPALTPSRGP